MATNNTRDKSYWKWIFTNPLYYIILFLGEIYPLFTEPLDYSSPVLTTIFFSAYSSIEIIKAVTSLIILLLFLQIPFFIYWLIRHRNRTYVKNKINTKKSWYERWWAIGIIIILLLMLINDFVPFERKIQVTTDFTKAGLGEWGSSIVEGTGNKTTIDVLCWGECLGVNEDILFVLDKDNTYYNSENYLVCGCKAI